MSDAGTSKGVPTATLVVFILLILAGGVAAYVIHTETSRLNTEYDKAVKEKEKTGIGLGEERAKLARMYQAVGFGSLDQIAMVFETSAVKVEPKKLETLTEEKFKRRDALVAQIGVKPKDKDQPPAVFLEQTITDIRQAAAVPDNLKNTRVGDLLEQFIRHDKAIAARDEAITQGEAAIVAVDRSITAKNAEIKSRFEDKDKKIEEGWEARGVEQKKLSVDPIEWAKERKGLEEKLSLEQAINRKLEHKREIQQDQASPIDGRITEYDWKMRRGSINLGARDGVKAGYEFDVFSTRPGPDRPDKRLMTGRIRLLNVYPDTSFFAVIPSDYESENRPIMAGQYVVSQLYDRVTRKVFVLKGWFPKGGDQSKEGLAGLIFRQGGIVEDELTLDTDYLVVGCVDEKELVNPSEEAKKAVTEGNAAYENARHWYVMVLTVEKCLTLMDRKGTVTAP